jgi:hypothetical protein
MGQSYESYIQTIVQEACTRGEAVDTARVADWVMEQFPGADRRLVLDCILAAVIRANGNASIGQ